MSKKIVKKRKIKIVAILLFFLVCISLYFLINAIFSFKIQNIFINGNSKLNDEYILELSGLEDYPSYYKTFSKNIEKKLLKSPFIKDVDVSKSFFGIVNIDIIENDILFYRVYDKTYVLDNLEEINEINYDFSPVRVINYIPDLVYDKFQKKVLELSEESKNKISEIKYDPSEYDDSRFLLYMIDGNYVYVTITKFDSINYYNEILPTLGDKKGILYLDSGNHFQEFNREQ